MVFKEEIRIKGKDFSLRPLVRQSFCYLWQAEFLLPCKACPTFIKLIEHYMHSTWIAGIDGKEQA